MTSPLDRVRATCLLLPGTEERSDNGQPAFVVADQPFARLSGDGASVSVRSDESEGWNAIDLAGDPDWPLVEDRLARSWELAAPGGLLEAGGR